MKQNEIKICSDCGTPLIWTFRWAGAEYYCLNCGTMGGVFGTGEYVKLTPELRLKRRVVNKIWKSIYSNNRLLLPACRYRRDNCEKCKKGAYHNQHLTKKEIKGNKIAERILKSVLHLFN